MGIQESFNEVQEKTKQLQKMLDYDEKKNYNISRKDRLQEWLQKGFISQEEYWREYYSILQDHEQNI